MQARFEALKSLLDELMDVIQSPIGAVSTFPLCISMADSAEIRVVAIVTEKGYVVVSASGQVVKCTTLAEVKSCFLSYFKVEGYQLNRKFVSHP